MCWIKCEGKAEVTDESRQEGKVLDWWEREKYCMSEGGEVQDE